MKRIHEQILGIILAIIGLTIPLYFLIGHTIPTTKHEQTIIIRTDSLVRSDTGMIGITHQEIILTNAKGQSHIRNYYPNDSLKNDSIDAQKALILMNHPPDTFVSFYGAYRKGDTCRKIVISKDGVASRSADKEELRMVWKELKEVDWTHKTILLRWILLISVLVSGTLALTIPVFRKLIEIWEATRIPFVPHLLSYLLLVGLLLYGAFLIQMQVTNGNFDFVQVMKDHFILIDGMTDAINVMVMILFWIPYLCIIGILMSNYILREVKEETLGDLEKRKHLINTFIQQRKNLDFFFLIIIFYLAGQILTTATLREAILLEIGFRDMIPFEIVYLYGGFYSFLAASIYLPVLFHFRSRANRIIDFINPISDHLPAKAGEKLNAKDLENWQKQSEVLESALGTQQSAMEILKIAFGILLPGIVSFLSSLIG